MHISFIPVLKKDVDQLRQIAIRTFRQSYQHLNISSNFNWYLDNAFNVEKLLSEISNDESYYYFISVENKIIGYLKLNVGDSQTESFNNEYLEIERIYLDKKYQRQGIGKKMIEFAFDKARTLQKNKVWLGVWDQNPNAILFYEQNGFERKGNHIFKFGDEDQNDVLMEIRLSKI